LSRFEAVDVGGIVVGVAVAVAGMRVKVGGGVLSVEAAGAQAAAAMTNSKKRSKRTIIPR
jgi:hypothetical protein